jgi:Flp pilus assembly protein TadG
MRTNLLQQNAGSVFVIVALSAMAVIGSVGVAVDVGRSQMVQAKLQNAVDSAGLAAGATLSTDDLTDVATKYVNLNFNQSNLGATLKTVNATLSADKKILTVTASATLPTTIMKIFGDDSVTINANTEVTRSNKGLELALVLDTTGSMAGTKLASLKTASHDLLDILFGTDATAENLWVGVAIGEYWILAHQLAEYRALCRVGLGLNQLGRLCGRALYRRARRNR